MINGYNIVDDNVKQIDCTLGEETKEWKIHELEGLIYSRVRSYPTELASKHGLMER